MWLFCYPYLGLNNIPICTVNDDENALGTLWGVGQFNHLEKDETPFAKCSNPPSTAAPESPARGVSAALNNVKVPPRPHSGESLATNDIFPEASCELSGVTGERRIVSMIVNTAAVILFKNQEMFSL